MISIDDFTRKAMDALEHNGKMQSTVRDVLRDVSTDEDERLNWVAKAVSEFRDVAEKWVSAGDESELQTRRKQVNNVVNDISRICRSELGHSIKCTTRKGGYVYEAVPAKTTPLGATDTAVTSTPSKIRDMVKYHRDRISNVPQQVLRELIVEHGRDKIGNMLVDVLREGNST